MREGAPFGRVLPKSALRFLANVLPIADLGLLRVWRLK